MDSLRKRSLFTILEENKYRQISFKGLIEDFPFHKAIITAGYEKFEAYEMLEVLENNSDVMDKMFTIFYNNHEGPIVFENKDHYEEQEYKTIFSRAKITIPQEQLDGYLALT